MYQIGNDVLRIVAERASNEGWQARIEGRTLDDNPYGPTKTYSRRFWTIGWLSAGEYIIDLKEHSAYFSMSEMIAFSQGYHAGVMGTDPSMCPHAPDDDASLMWQSGWGMAHKWMEPSVEIGRLSVVTDEELMKIRSVD